MKIKARSKYRNKKTNDLIQPVDLLYDSDVQGYYARGFFNGKFQRFLIRNCDLEYLEEVGDGAERLSD